MRILQYCLTIVAAVVIGVVLFAPTTIPEEWRTRAGFKAIALAVAAVFFLIGLLAGDLFARSTLSLVRREFTAYFMSPIAYVVLTVFLLGTGFLYLETFKSLTDQGPRGVEYPMSAILGEGSEGLNFPVFWLVFLFVPPLLTMRLFAEERATGTMETLMTAPITDSQIVLAKFLGCFAFYLLMWLPTLVYLPILMDLSPTWNLGAWTAYSAAFAAGLGIVLIGALLMPAGFVGRGFLIAVAGALVAAIGGYLHYTKDAVHLVSLTAGIDPWPVLTTYIGVIAAGVMFLALGLFVSSLVKGQMIAALLSITLAIPFVLPVVALPYLEPSGTTYKVLAYITVPHHFGHDFTRGVLDTRHLTLYLSAGALLLFLTVRSVESQRR
jgi:ABC-2 type transport system permease protein